MKLASYMTDGKSAFGVVTGDGVITLNDRLRARYPTLRDALAGGALEEIASTAKSARPDRKLSEVRFLPPIPNPEKIMCVGINYKSHAAEHGQEAPKLPNIFTRFVNTLVPHEGEMIRPKVSTSFDFEGELAVIIGRLCRGVPRERAEEVVFGYTCANDVTARDLQARDGQWTRAKGFDTFCPLGPWMETGTNPTDLELTTTVNGEIRQQARTSELLWDVPGLIAYVSQVMTLLPGDVLLTGTPAGVGPLTDGDEVSVTIESIGTLTNRVVIGD